MEERMFHVLIKDVCDEMGIKMEKLSYNWILQLTKDEKVRHITSSTFDLNPEASGIIANDKYATYTVLNSQNIPVIKHTMIFNPATRIGLIEDNGIWSIITTEFLKYGSLVVKPNSGCEGQGVYLCKTMKEVENAVEKLFKTQDSISVCPYYNIKTEYRTFYLDGEIKLIYGKNKPFVIGDGVTTLGELIGRLNLPNKNVVKDNLKNFDFTYIPKLNEKIDLSWKYNLSGGAIPTILEKNELYNKIENIAIAAGKAMNIGFATIDVIETEDDELYVLEVNSGIGTTIFTELIDDGDKIIKDIFKSAITKLFE